MGKIIKIILLFLVFPLAYFIYQTGDTALGKVGLGYGTPEYTLMLLTVLLPILAGLLILFGLMKSMLVKYIPPLLLLNIAAIAWLKMSL